MKHSLLVGVGGMIGSILRYRVGAWSLHAFPNALFPWGTFTVNCAGCFLIGAVASLGLRLSFLDESMKFLLITGFLGGFTTFSAFGLETVALLKRGEYAFAASSVAANVCGGIFAAWLGLLIFSYRTE